MWFVEYKIVLDKCYYDSVQLVIELFWTFNIYKLQMERKYLCFHVGFLPHIQNFSTTAAWKHGVCVCALQLECTYLCLVLFSGYANLDFSFLINGFKTWAQNCIRHSNLYQPTYVLFFNWIWSVLWVNITKEKKKVVRMDFQYILSLD